MKIDSLGQWLALIGNLAVLFGLMLVAYELRQDREIALGDTQNILLGILHERDSWLASAQFAEIVVKAELRDEKLTDVEYRQYAEWLYGKLNACELMFDRFQAGLVSADYWAAWNGGCKEMLESAQARAVWEDRKSWYGPEFARFLDQQIESLE